MMSSETKACGVANPGGTPCTKPKGHPATHDEGAYGPPMSSETSTDDVKGEAARAQKVKSVLCSAMVDSDIKTLEGALNNVLLNVYDLSNANAPIPPDTCRDIADHVGAGVGKCRLAIERLRSLTSKPQSPSPRPAPEGAERVRSAAVRKAGVVYPCFAHTYHEITRLNLDAPEDVLKGEDSEQGFVTTTGRFVNRAEAFLIADREGQIIFKHGSVNVPRLYSEDLRGGPIPSRVEGRAPSESSLRNQAENILFSVLGSPYSSDVDVHDRSKLVDRITAALMIAHRSAAPDCTYTTDEEIARVILAGIEERNGR